MSEQTGDRPLSDPQVFRDVIGRFATGVTVVTTRHDGRDHGMTASAVSSLSLEPPMLLVCISRDSPTGAAVRAAGTFQVNVLTEQQSDLANRFAMPLEDKFDDLDVERGALGAVSLPGALAHLECRVVDDVEAGTHRIFIGEVVRAEGREGAPLAYYRGEFGQLHLSAQDEVTALLRERLLSPTAPDADDLVAGALADELGVGASRVERALSQLRGEGLLTGDPVHGYAPAPVDAPAVEDALQARRVIERGALTVAVGRLDDAEVAELRRLAEATAAVMQDGAAVDVDAYARANTAFHEAVVRSAGSAALLEAYRRLSLPGILVRGVRDPRDLVAAHAEDHRAIAGAYEHGDLEAAQAAIDRHTERALATHAQARSTAP